MTRKDLEDFLLSFPDTWLDFPFGEKTSVHKVGSRDQGKMFALVQDDRLPLRLSLKCDPVLADTLRAKYETVIAGYHLSKKHWNTIILTGQLSDAEIEDLIRHSYSLVAG